MEKVGSDTFIIASDAWLWCGYTVIKAPMSIGQGDLHTNKISLAIICRSFGHHQAKEFAITEGLDNQDANKAQTKRGGFCKTRLSVCKVKYKLGVL